MYVPVATWALFTLSSSIICSIKEITKLYTCFFVYQIYISENGNFQQYHLDVTFKPVQPLQIFDYTSNQVFILYKILYQKFKLKNVQK